MNLKRFMTYVSKRVETTCWIWSGGKTPKGYGKCAHAGRTLGAHVVSYILHKGPIPEDLIIRHTCRIKACVNPEHLLAGTYKQNLEDARIDNGRIGRLPTYPDALVNKVYWLRQSLLSTKTISLKLALPIDYVTGVLSGHIRKELKTKYEKEFGSIPKFHSGHKYSDEDRMEMVRMYQDGMSPSKIAQLYGTNYKYVWKLSKKELPLQRRGDI